MAKPNYSFEKRQRELAKKKKKEEKLKDKETRKTTPEHGGDESAQPQGATSTDSGSNAA
mgnify:CR=1 FL=1